MATETPSVQISGSSNNEGTTGGDPNYLGFAITLSEAATNNVTVGYRLLSGTAQAGSDVYDYGSSGTSVTFAPGETSKTVYWRIDADSTSEPDESVVMEIYQVSGSAKLAGNATVLRATGWVIDDDGSGNKLALFASRPMVVEGDTGTTQANFEISLSRPAPEAFTVQYTTVDGSARAGEDYTTTTGTLSFVAGQTTASVSVPVSGDTVIEPTDLFSLSFTTPEWIAQSSLGEATILDDDAGTPTVSIAGTSNNEGTTGGDPNYLGFAIT
ncbi:MAG TPA: Calx-beta domain-containing protein, partial [Zoogloea sp.]|nr:Calx-beta domain-containing protein [Zoogloea sp.]